MSARLGLFPMLFLLAAGSLPGARAATFTVDSTTDAVDANPGDGMCDDGTGSCTLRAAIMEVNALAGADTIQVPIGTYVLTIGSGDDSAVQGDLDLRDSNVVIAGAGVDATIVDGNDLDRVFEIRTGIVAEFADLTIRNGNTGANGGGLHVQNGSANLTNVAVRSCVAAKGAGIYANGPLNATDLTVSGNTGTGAEGGGIRVDSNPAVLERATIDSNTCTDGAGLYVKGGGSSLVATNITVTGNTATGRGGGMWSDHAVTLTNVTFADNSAGNQGGNIHINGSTVTAVNSIFANAGAGGDCSGSITSTGSNIDSDNTCGLGAAGDTTGIDPLLGPLQDNGGPTLTRELLSGSAAIDRGAAASCPAEDQRGVSRPVGSTCDVGAFEFGGPPPQPLVLVKKAFRVDGTPVTSGETLPTGTLVRYLLYVDNPAAGVIDVSLQDVLEAGFTYQAGTIRYDNSVATCGGGGCSAAQEAAIYAAAVAGTAGSDAVDGDVVSVVGATIDAGNQNAGNARLDVAGNKVWAMVFTVRVNAP